MFDRRSFLSSAGASAALFGTAMGRSWFRTAEQDKGAPAKPPRIPRSTLVFDAMGEVRSLYTSDLLREMLASGLNAITVTICDPRTYETAAMDAAMKGVLSYDKYITSQPELLLKATKTVDIDSAVKEKKLAIFYLCQNSTQFGRDLSRVDVFYRLGVRSSQITYNFQNWAGAGCMERTDAGLSHFGLALVEKMNSVGMLIDVSHANMTTMADVIRTSKEPTVISHTACMAVYPHKRNATDANLRLLGKHGGVVGICQIRPFLVDIRKGAFAHYLKHILHAIEVAGIDHVGIGSDRDHRVIKMTRAYMDQLRSELGPNYNAKEWPLFMDKLNGPRRMEIIWSGLKKKGLKARDLEKVMGGNLRRVYGEVVG